MGAKGPWIKAEDETLVGLVRLKLIPPRSYPLNGASAGLWFLTNHDCAPRCAGQQVRDQAVVHRGGRLARSHGEAVPRAVDEQPRPFDQEGPVDGAGTHLDNSLPK